MADLTIDMETLQNGVVYVRLAGFLDAHTFERLDERIEELFDQNQYRLIVDLSELEYISSAGAGVFIGAIGEAQDHQGNIVLLSPTESVKEVFDLLGLSQIFSFTENRQDALAEFDDTPVK